MSEKTSKRVGQPIKQTRKSRRQARARMRLYILLIIASLLLIIGIALSRANHRLNLSMVRVSVEELFFEEPIQEVTQWHNREAKFVYLTFNDGPSGNSDRIMDVLDAHGINGTFFVLGSAIQNNSDSKRILNRMVESGHYIGLHSMTRDANHLYRDDNAPQNFADEMLELQALVSQMTDGFESNLCRAPLGSIGTLSDKHIELILDSGLNCWDWHIDARDWSQVTVEDIMGNIEEGMMLWRHPNHVVILFQESDVAIEALPSVIEYYLELGYEFLPYNPIRHFPINFINNPDL